MPYDIVTKDNIKIRNIPDNIPRDSDILKERVRKARIQKNQDVIDQSTQGAELKPGEFDLTLPEPDPSEGRSFFDNLTNTLAMGFGDELEGFEQALKAAYSRGEISKEQFEKDYRAGKQAWLDRMKKNEEVNPKASTAGKVASMFVPGGVAASTVKSIPKVTAVGAGIGATSGLGYSDADLLEGEVGEAVEDVLVGATIGSIGGYAGGKLSSKLDDLLGVKLGEQIRKKALTADSKKLEGMIDQRLRKDLGNVWRQKLKKTIEELPVKDKNKFLDDFSSLRAYATKEFLDPDGGVLLNVPKKVQEIINNKKNVSSKKLAKEMSELAENAKFYNNNFSNLNSRDVAKEAYKTLSDMTSLGVGGLDAGAISLGINRLAPRLLKNIKDAGYKKKLTKSLYSLKDELPKIKKKFKPSTLEKISKNVRDLNFDNNPFKSLIEEASKTLGVSAGAIHNSLLTSNPEYRSWVRQELKNEGRENETLIFNKK